MTDKRTYTHEEVAVMLGVHRSTVYTMPKVMACRLSLGLKRGVRYSAAPIDALVSPPAKAA